MKIQKNAFVSLTYELRTDGTAEGPLVEKVDSTRPLKFVYGSGLMLPIFEERINNLSEGEKFEFTLAPNEAYGEYNDNAVVDVPKDVFVVDGQLRDDLLKIGNHVPMMGEGGQRLDGRIIDITDANVKMDFNHPLAGETLYFVGQIIEVREATDDELHPHHCCGGCGGGSCGSNGNSCGDGNCGCGGNCH